MTANPGDALGTSEVILRRAALGIALVGCFTAGLFSTEAMREVLFLVLVVVLESLVWVLRARQTVSPTSSLLIYFLASAGDLTIGTLGFLLICAFTMARCGFNQSAVVACIALALSAASVSYIPQMLDDPLQTSILQAAFFGLYPLFVSPAARDRKIVGQAAVQSTSAALVLLFQAGPVAYFLLAAVALEWVRRDFGAWMDTIQAHRSERDREITRRQESRRISQNLVQRGEMTERRNRLKEFLYSEPYALPLERCREASLEYLLESEMVRAAALFTAEGRCLVSRPDSLELPTSLKEKMAQVHRSGRVQTVQSKQDQVLLHPFAGNVLVLRCFSLSPWMLQRLEEDCLLLSVVDTVSLQRQRTAQAIESERTEIQTLEGLVRRNEKALATAVALHAAAGDDARNDLMRNWPEEESALARLLSGVARVASEIEADTENRAREYRRSEALSLARVEAERQATLGTLAAGIAHEVNTPLGTVLLSMDTLQMHLPSMERELEEAAEETLALQSLIERLLALARENTDRPTRFGLGELCSHIVKLMEKGLSAQGYDCSVEVDREQEIVAIRPQMQQLLLDLVTELKSLRQGGHVKVSVTAGPTLTLSLEGRRNEGAIRDEDKASAELKERMMKRLLDSIGARLDRWEDADSVGRTVSFESRGTKA